MAKRPRIYAYCPAGCRWETVHRDELLNYATYLNVSPSGASSNEYIFEKGKEYKIFEGRNTDGTFKGVLTFYIDSSDGDALGIKFDMPAVADEYNDSFTFRLLDVKYSTPDGGNIVLDFAGCRYELPWSGATGTLTIYARYIGTSATRVYEYNSEANFVVSLESGDVSGMREQIDALTAKDKSLQNQIDAEKSAREELNATDAELQEQIDAEQSARGKQTAELQAQIDTINATIMNFVNVAEEGA